MVYTTIQGDSWDLISYKIFGLEKYAPKIMSANIFYRDVQIFEAGIVLAIPDISEEEINNEKQGLPPWRVWE